MATLLRIVLQLVVDALLIAHKAGVDCEANLDRAMLNDLLLHMLRPLDRITVLRFEPRETLLVCASCRALRNVAAARLVGHACIGDNACTGKVSPGMGQIPTTAA